MITSIEASAEWDGLVAGFEDPSELDALDEADLQWLREQLVVGVAEWDIEIPADASGDEEG